MATVVDSCKQSTKLKNYKKSKRKKKKLNRPTNLNLVNSISVPSKCRANNKTLNRIMTFLKASITKENRNLISRIRFSRPMSRISILIRRDRNQTIIYFWSCLNRIKGNKVRGKILGRLSRNYRLI